LAGFKLDNVLQKGGGQPSHCYNPSPFPNDTTMTLALGAVEEYVGVIYIS
jgi:hypothetical protein